MSQNTYELVRDKYRFESRGKIKVKGKGELACYLYKGRKSGLNLNHGAFSVTKGKLSAELGISSVTEVDKAQPANSNSHPSSAVHTNSNNTNSKQNNNNSSDEREQIVGILQEISAVVPAATSSDEDGAHGSGAAGVRARDNSDINVASLPLLDEESSPHEEARDSSSSSASPSSSSSTSLLLSPSSPVSLSSVAVSLSGSDSNQTTVSVSNSEVSSDRSFNNSNNNNHNSNNNHNNTKTSTPSVLQRTSKKNPGNSGTASPSNGNLGSIKSSPKSSKKHSKKH